MEINYWVYVCVRFLLCITLFSAAMKARKKMYIEAIYDLCFIIAFCAITR